MSGKSRMAATKIIEMYATFRRYGEEMEFFKKSILKKSKIKTNDISKVGQKSSKQKREINHTYL